MVPALKSEIKKILTVRSTYGILIFCLILMLIYAFWAEGIRAGDSTRAAADPEKLANLLREAVSTLALFGGLVGILLISNEYRYNTITYTVTASKSRTKILLSKIIAAALFSAVFTVFVALVSPALMYLGFAIKGFALSHQTFPPDLIWRLFYMSWGYATLGLLLGTLIRQQIGAIVAYLAIPLFAEQLLGLLLNDNSKFLPYSALMQVSSSQGYQNALSHGKAALVFLLYLAVGWLIAWYLFIRRDAT